MAADPVLVVLFDISGGNGQMGGGIPLRTADHSLFVHKSRLAQTLRGRGRKQCAPCLAHVTHKRGH